jgi:replicative DNA helicase
MVALAIGLTYLLAGLILLRGPRTRGFLAVVAWPLTLFISLARRVRRNRAMEPANSLPGRVVPHGVPITRALREGTPDLEEKPRGHDRSLEAEQAMLGAMVFDNGVIEGVLDVVGGAGALAFPAHRTIFEAILRLHRRGKPFDLVALRDELAGEGSLDLVGGAPYLAHLIDSMPSAANALEYAGTVRDKHILRTCSGIPRGMGEVVREVFRDLENMSEGTSAREPILTGFRALDTLTGGLQPGCLHIVAGRPSMGKTSFVLSVVLKAALRDWKKVLLFSPETRAADIVLAMIASEGRIDMNDLRRGRLAEEDYQRMVLAAGALHEAGIFIDDTPGIGVSDILGRVREKQGAGLDLVVVDGWGALRPEPGASGMAAFLERLAWEYRIPVVATVPLGRGPEHRGDHRPAPGDLKSPSMAESASLVLLLYREDYYDPNSPRRNLCDVIVAKNRSGPPGTVELRFLKPFMRLENPGVPADPAGAGNG